MKTSLVLVAIGIVIGFGLAPPGALARDHDRVIRTGGSAVSGGGHGFSGGFSARGGHGFHGGRVVVPHRFSHQPFFHHARPFGMIAPPVVYGSPYFYDEPDDDAAAVYAPPAFYAPPPSGSVPVATPPPPPAPPLPRVVEFPEGRYELRGDGVSAPYMWVWVPAAPTAPPLSSRPAEPSPPPSGEKARARPSQLYRWTDPDGVVHWTDDLGTVPGKYRARVQRIRPS